MPIDKHLDWHAVFSNRTPLEQIQKIVDLNYPIWSVAFSAEIYRLLRSYQGGLAYKEEAIKTKKKLIENL